MVFECRPWRGCRDREILQFVHRGKGVSQDDIDRFVVKVMDSLQKEGMKVSSIRTGGQTGVDESGAVAGVVLGIPTTVHAPKGWAFRGADNKDVKAEAAFKGRFETKDYQALRKLVCTTKKVVYQQSILLRFI